MDAVPFPTDADAVPYPRLTLTELVGLRREGERLLLDPHAIDPDPYVVAVKVVRRVDTELRDRSWDSLRVMLVSEADNTRAIAHAEWQDVAVLPSVIHERNNATQAVNAVVKAVDAINRRRFL